jgi:hypothetical protein
VLDINALPDDVANLKRLVVEHHAASQAKDVQLRERDQQIEHLKFQLAKLRRARFGQSSEPPSRWTGASCPRLSRN